MSPADRAADFAALQQRLKREASERRELAASQPKGRGARGSGARPVRGRRDP
jgi:hypothetical protein